MLSFYLLVYLQALTELCIKTMLMSSPDQHPVWPRKRKLRVYNRFFTRAWNAYAIFPEIRLAGRWLLESGFTAGQSIRVTHEHGKIVITPDEVKNEAL